MTFLFDIGNVLLKLHFDRFHRTVLGAADAPFPPELAALKDPYETGALSDQDFIRQSLDILGSQLSPENFTRAWQNIFSPNEAMWDVVPQLKEQGHRLILFSNTNKLHALSFLQAFPGFELFDHHHFSHEVGAIKPDPAFYQKAIAQYQLDPAQTLYLDDLPENIATGRDLGFHSWQYDLNNHQPCLDWLSGHGIPLAPPP